MRCLQTGKKENNEKDRKKKVVPDENMIINIKKLLENGEVSLLRTVAELRMGSVTIYSFDESYTKLGPEDDAAIHLASFFEVFGEDLPNLEENEPSCEKYFSKNGEETNVIVSKFNFDNEKIEQLKKSCFRVKAFIIIIINNNNQEHIEILI